MHSEKRQLQNYKYSTNSAIILTWSFNHFKLFSVWKLQRFKMMEPHIDTMSSGGPGATTSLIIWRSEGNNIVSKILSFQDLAGGHPNNLITKAQLYIGNSHISPEYSSIAPDISLESSTTIS